jgi:hypothetical protein
MTSRLGFSRTTYSKQHQSQHILVFYRNGDFIPVSHVLRLSLKTLPPPAHNKSLPIYYYAMASPQNNNNTLFWNYAIIDT